MVSVSATWGFTSSTTDAQDLCQLLGNGRPGAADVHGAFHQNDRTVGDYGGHHAGRTGVVAPEAHGHTPAAVLPLQGVA